jgi:hypothetical protein
MYYLWLIPLFVVGFAAYFALVVWCVSFVTGWRLLAQRFRAPKPFLGKPKWYPFRTVRMRVWANYSGSLKLLLTAEGLYMAPIFLFGPGHPPLLIPWSEIEVHRTEFLWVHYHVLILGKSQERIPMRISDRFARELGVPEAPIDAIKLNFE